MATGLYDYLGSVVNLNEDLEVHSSRDPDWPCSLRVQVSCYRILDPGVFLRIADSSSADCRRIPVGNNQYISKSTFCLRELKMSGTL
jgi:hypothetical protein